MKMKKLLKLFNHKHKFIYAKLMRDECKDIYVRFCKCGMVEHRKYHMGEMIWGGGIVYTDKGARDSIDGYGET